MESQLMEIGNKQVVDLQHAVVCDVLITVSMMKMRLHVDERRLLGFQRTERETGVGSITSTIDLERGIAMRMQENRDDWSEAGPVSMWDYKDSHGGGGS